MMKPTVIKTNNFFKLTKPKLKKVGYKAVPNHSYGRQCQQQWITNSGTFGSKFPRYHITRENNEWLIHYDLGGEYHTEENIIFSGSKIDKEIKRIKRLC